MKALERCPSLARKLTQNANKKTLLGLRDPNPLDVVVFFEPSAFGTCAFNRPTHCIRSSPVQHLFCLSQVALQGANYSDRGTGRTATK